MGTAPDSLASVANNSGSHSWPRGSFLCWGCDHGGPETVRAEGLQVLQAQQRRHEATLGSPVLVSGGEGLGGRCTEALR